MDASGNGSGKITPYGYGISSEKVERKKGIRPNLGKRNIIHISFDFSYTEEVSLSKTDRKRAGDMQC